MRTLLLLPLLLPLAACQLVDQRTVATWFGGQAQAPTKADLATARLPAMPIVVVRYDDPGANSGPELAQAAEAALAHNPAAVFDVLAPLPSAAPVAEQNRFATQGAADTRAVADMLATDGVPPKQIRLGLETDPGHPVREVRVYVR